MNIHRKSIKILHLSDVHIGELNGINFKHALPTGNEDGQSRLGEVVSKALEENNMLDEADPLFVVVSGDLVCDGDKPFQHKNACKAFRDLMKKLKIENRGRVFFVPGNHDVERDAEMPMRNHNEEFMAAFYGGELTPEEKKHRTNNGIELKNYIPPKNFGYSSFKKDQWVYWDNENRLAFILLYSQYVDANKKEKLPPWLKKCLKENLNLEDGWKFDRGLIEEEQFEQIAKQLNEKPFLQDYLKIAVFHHNPMPVVRNCASVDSFKYPETGLLANGPEVLYRLQRLGVSIVLHGHRHQNSIYYSFGHEMNESLETEVQNGLIVLGAPSIGCSYAGDIGEIDGPWIPQRDWLGFNHITIERSVHKTAIKLFRFKSNSFIAGVREFTREPREEPLQINLSAQNNNDNGHIPILGFKQGLELLGEEMIKANQQVVLLNYRRSKIDWEDLFEDFWQEVPAKNNLLESFINVTGHDYEDKDDIKATLENAINLKYYSKEFINLIRHKRSAASFIIEALKDESKAEEEPFLSYVCQRLQVLSSNSRTKRQLNYLIELLRCAIDEKFNIYKGVYFFPPQNPSTKSTGDLEGKFEWLLRSILAARYIPNYQLAWIPFAIRDYRGKSLVATSRPQSSGRNSILLGYADGDPKSVLYIGSDMHLGVGGKLHQSLGALIKKVIHPLSKRLLDDFPIYKQGKLYKKNVQVLAYLFGCESVWVKYENDLDRTFKGKYCSIQNNINESKINKLYKWVLKKQEDAEIPWVSDDREYILKKIKERKFKAIFVSKELN